MANSPLTPETLAILDSIDAAERRIIAVTLHIDGKHTADGQAIGKLIPGWLEGTGATWTETAAGFDIHLDTRAMVASESHPPGDPHA